MRTKQPTTRQAQKYFQENGKNYYEQADIYHFLEQKKPTKKKERK